MLPLPRIEKLILFCRVFFFSFLCGEVLQNDGTVGRSGNDFPLYCGVIVAPKVR